MAAVAETFRLHGHPVSNYFNTVFAALIEKDASFEIVQVGASQDEAFLARSPMGKIPYLETAQGCIAETVAIVEYLEDEIPNPSYSRRCRIGRGLAPFLVGGLNRTSVPVAPFSSRRFEGLAGLKEGSRAFGGTAASAMSEQA